MYEDEKWPIEKFARYIKDCVTVTELAEMTGMSRSTIHRWKDEGKFEYLKLENKHGSLVFIPKNQFVDVYFNPRVLPLPERLRAQDKFGDASSTSPASSS